MIAEDVHVETTGPMAMLNHCCSPNVGLAFPPASYDPGTVADLVRKGSLDALFPTVVALADIPTGAELTFHYGTTEWEVVAPFACRCGSEHCCGMVRGYKHMSDAERRSVSGLVAPHLERACGPGRPGSLLDTLPAWQGKRVRVCVLVSLYAESASDTAGCDDMACTPALYFPDAVVGEGPVGPALIHTLSQEHLRAAGFPSVVSTPRFVFFYVRVRKSNAYAHVRDLATSGAYDVFFNLCDGAVDSDTAGVEVAQALERFGAAFTGVASVHYEPSKVEMKMLASYAGLNVPPYFVARTGGPAVADLVASSGVQFPLIVKHPSGYASIGTTKASRCTTLEELELEVRRVCTRFGGQALVEEFIEGKEVTVLTAEVLEDPIGGHGGCAAHPGGGVCGGIGSVAGGCGCGDGPGAVGGGGGGTCHVAASGAGAGHASFAACSVRIATGGPDLGHGPAARRPCVSFAPVQMSFPAGEAFKHFDLKWTGHAGMHWSRVMGQPALEASVRAAGVAAFQAIMGGRGYCRCDLRVDAQGTVWFLEINPNCGLFYPPGDKGSADWILTLDPTTSAVHFAEAMVVAALQRQCEAAARAPAWEVFHSARGGFGMRAARAIAPGEVVFADEGSSVNLVSRRWVQERWPAVDRAVFARYAWPVSDEVFAIWNEDHKRWRPLNHSCDPNLWFGEGHSLNVYARRAIGPGEELTMGYETFCSGPYFGEFECGCGSRECRKRITGRDYVAHGRVRALYGTRVTHYVYAQAVAAGVVHTDDGPSTAEPDVRASASAANLEKLELKLPGLERTYREQASMAGLEHLLWLCHALGVRPMLVQGASGGVLGLELSDAHRLLAHFVAAGGTIGRLTPKPCGSSGTDGLEAGLMTLLLAGCDTPLCVQVDAATAGPHLHPTDSLSPQRRVLLGSYVWVAARLDDNAAQAPHRTVPIVSADGQQWPQLHLTTAPDAPGSAAVDTSPATALALDPAASCQGLPPANGSGPWSSPVILRDFHPATLELHVPAHVCTFVGPGTHWVVPDALAPLVPEPPDRDAEAPFTQLVFGTPLWGHVFVALLDTKEDVLCVPPGFVRVPGGPVLAAAVPPAEHSTSPT